MNLSRVSENARQFFHHVVLPDCGAGHTDSCGDVLSSHGDSGRDLTFYSAFGLHDRKIEVTKKMNVTADQSRVGQSVAENSLNRKRFEQRHGWWTSNAAHGCLPVTEEGYSEFFLEQAEGLSFYPSIQIARTLAHKPKSGQSFPFRCLSPDIPIRTASALPKQSDRAGPLSKTPASLAPIQESRGGGNVCPLQLVRAGVATGPRDNNSISSRRTLMEGANALRHFSVSRVKNYKPRTTGDRFPGGVQRARLLSHVFENGMGVIRNVGQVFRGNCCV
jgi:hypothetical protein